MSFNVPRIFICEHCNTFNHESYHEARVHYEERHSQTCPACGKTMTHVIAATQGFVAGRSYDLNPPDRV